MSELAVARVVAVEPHPGARAPSFLVTLDFGERGRLQAVLSTGDYAPQELEGAQVLCRREGEQVAIVAAHSHGLGLVLLRPDRDVEDGTVVD